MAESEGKTMINNGGSEGFEGLEKEVVEVGNNKKMRRRTRTIFESLLRVLALVLTLSATVIVGVNKQTKVVPIKVVDTLPPISVPVSAKWHYLSAFMYFVVANAIACSYTTLSLVLSLANRGSKNCSTELAITALDVVMTALLFSANGAAAAIGLMGYKGNSHVQWKKVCNVFSKFCVQGTFALVISVIGAVAFLLLVVLSVKRLHK